MGRLTRVAEDRRTRYARTQLRVRHLVPQLERRAEVAFGLGIRAGRTRRDARSGRSSQGLRENLRGLPVVRQLSGGDALRFGRKTRHAGESLRERAMHTGSFAREQIVVEGLTEQGMPKAEMLILGDRDD